MKVSKNYWHYWLVDNVFTYPSRNLCTYFWQVPAAVCVITVTVALCTAIALLGVYVLSTPIWANVIQTDWQLICIMGCASAYIWYDLVFSNINKRYKDSTWNIIVFKKRSTSTPVDKKPSLVWEYLKAKKDKVCPIIEWH